LVFERLQATRRPGSGVDAVRRMTVDLLLTGICWCSSRCPILAVNSLCSVGREAALTALSAGARWHGVEAMNEGGGAGVLNGADDGALLAAATRIARQTASTARVHTADPGWSPGGASAQVTQTDGAVVGGGGAEVAVEQLSSRHAVDTVVGSVTSTST